MRENHTVHSIKVIHNT